MPGRARLWLAGGVVVAAAAAGAFLLLPGDTPQPQISASLRLIAAPVEVYAVAGETLQGVDGQLLVAGDTVRTGADGRAAIDYPDGSVTRLDHDTEFTITTLERGDGGGRVVVGTQTSGNSYHRVVGITEAGSRFDVAAPTATVSVQGTIFAVFVGLDGSTTTAGIDGTVAVDTGTGVVIVEAGFMVIVGADGSVVGPIPIPDDLIGGDWILFNQCELDEEGDCPDDEPSPPAFDHIEIAPAASEIVAGSAETYVVTAFDTSGAAMGDVTGDAAITGVGCAGAACSPTEAGEHAVTAGYQGTTATAMLTVIPGPVAVLEVSPATAIVDAGDPQEYSAEGFDAYGNSLESISADFAVADGVCVAASCSSTVAGEHEVTAMSAGVTDTAMLTITPGPLARIAIHPGTVEVPYATAVGYWAEGFDQYHNTLGPVGATYDMGQSGWCLGSACTASGSGTFTVIGTHGALSDTATMHVLPGQD